MKKIEGIKLYSVYRSDIPAVNKVLEAWDSLSDDEKQRWDALAAWVRDIADKARAYGYEQGERGGLSRASVRPGHGDMGG